MHTTATPRQSLNINVKYVDEGKNYTKTLAIRHSRPTFQQVLNIIGRRCVARLGPLERQCIMHCHRNCVQYYECGQKTQ